MFEKLPSLLVFAVILVLNGMSSGPQGVLVVLGIVLIPWAVSKCKEEDKNE